ncbi:MAG: hypothetical protein FJ278_01820 [Planctomycetes bacterium]|nr:hypothetical protein [Planctomycetota bacterium]
MTGIAALFLGTAVPELLSQEKPSNVDREEAKQRLAQVKVVSVCENVTGGFDIGRPVAETIRMLKETHTDLIFRGFWKRLSQPVLESPDEIPPELAEVFKNKKDLIRETGYHYQQLKAAISEIKKELPHLIFMGALPAQATSRIEWNPITGRIHGPDETWNMALDPQKWKVTKDGKPWLKEEFQKWLGSTHGHQWVKADQDYDRRKAPAYFPDITHPEFQDLLLSWAKKQIDCGADGLWIDMLWTQVGNLYRATKHANHPAVKESLASASRIVDEIHRYGESKGKYVYVGTWNAGSWMDGHKLDNIDFVTTTPSNKEVLDRKLEQGKWERAIGVVRRLHGDAPFFAFLDSGADVAPIVMFSQKLAAEEQREALKTFDESFARLGINFAYPLRFGYMGRSEITTRLAFGKSRFYDSLAPEFAGNYEVIRELAQRKATASKEGSRP